MPLLGYQARFAPLVASGEKRQTVRARRKRPIKAGDTLYHYTRAWRLRVSVCTHVQDISISEHGDLLWMLWSRCLPDRETFARQDGFASWAEMLEWVRHAHGLPFAGQLIEW